MVDLAEIRKRAQAQKEKERAATAAAEEGKKGAPDAPAPVEPAAEVSGEAPQVEPPPPARPKRALKQKPLPPEPEPVRDESEPPLPVATPVIPEEPVRVESPPIEEELIEIRRPPRVVPAPAPEPVAPRAPEKIPAKEMAVSKPSRPAVAISPAPAPVSPPAPPPMAELEPEQPLEVIPGGFGFDEGDAVQEVLREFLTFALGGEEYAIPIDRIVEIVPHRQTTPVPNTDGTIVGILSLRGVVVTILDMRSRLGGKGLEVTAETRFVVIGLEKEMVGLLVDRVRRVVRFSEKEIEPPPRIGSGEGSDCVAGVIERGGKIVVVLDLDRLLDAGIREVAQ